MEVLRPLVAQWLADQGRSALVGADQFIYWEQFSPRKAVAPDVYVLPGVSPDTPVTAWKVWETGVVPSFCFESVSGDRLKDYEEAPKRYAELGVEELVLFDPHAEESARRVRWQVYRRIDGELTRVEATDADRVRSASLGCWLRQTGSGMAMRVRVGIGPRGDELVPTDAERASAAEEELRRVRAELERLRGGKR
jgi:hypothetical protein